MIDLTDNAVKHLQDLLRSKEVGVAQGLRLRVEKGGCAGMQYAMMIDEVVEGDEVTERNGVRLFVDRESLSLLDGSVVDYIDDLNDSGFKVQNPQAARSCGCGTSFEPKEEA